MPANKKPRKSHKPKLVKIPVAKPLWDSIALQMHTSLASFESQPSIDAFDALGMIFNVFGMTVSEEPKLRDEGRIIDGAVSIMCDIAKKLDGLVSGAIKLRDHEIGGIRLGVRTIDAVIPRLDVSKIYIQMQRLRAMKMAGAY